MILNTGSRTDIPAFYSDWFFNRIDAGYVMARNPFYPELVYKFPLNPDVIDAIIFCTKNPEPMLNRMEKLRKYRQYWFITITPYDEKIEENVPPYHKVIEGVKKLNNCIDRKAICWRYDPIFIDEKYTIDYHIKIFESMMKELSKYVSRCVISFIDLYEKTIKNFEGVKEVCKEDQVTLVKAFSEISKRYDVKLMLCHEDEDLAIYGADPTGCLSKEVVEDAFDIVLDKTVKGKARDGCSCLLGNDIGAYNTCLHGCKYCYANYDMNIVRKNYLLHDKNSPLLIGNIKEGDIIKEVDAKSNIDKQIRLF